MALVVEDARKDNMDQLRRLLAPRNHQCDHCSEAFDNAASLFSHQKACKRGPDYKATAKPMFKFIIFPPNGNMTIRNGGCKLNKII